MRAHRPPSSMLRTMLVAMLFLLALGACGSSGNGGDGADGADGTPTTTAAPAGSDVNEQSNGGDAGGTRANSSGGAGSGPILTDAQRITSLCNTIDAAPDEDLPAVNGDGDAKNYAGAVRGLVDSLEEKCDDEGKP